MKESEGSTTLMSSVSGVDRHIKIKKLGSLELPPEVRSTGPGFPESLPWETPNLRTRSGSSSSTPKTSGVVVHTEYQKIVLL